MNKDMLELLNELRTVTLAISEMNLEEEANHGLLLSLQGQQKEIGEKVDKLKTEHSHIFQETEISLLMECVEMEKVIHMRLKCKKNEVNEHISKISAGKKSRGAYQSEYTQHVGYFIDGHQ